MAVGIDVAGIAGMEPSLGILHLHRRLRILVVLLEEARRADQQLALRCELELDAGHRRADRVGLHLVVGLDADEHAGLGRAVELLEIDAEGTVEDE